ncbi:MAG TPA: DUF4328 domain-containing protein [Polyangiaceae bacterium]|jgi:hypothetical protein
MSAYNPYLAPQAQQAGPYPAYGPAWSQERYVPLGWRTVLAALCIAAAAVFGLALDAVQLSVGDRMEGESADVGAALLVFFVAVAFLGSLVLAAIFFGIWIHRAAKNLRGLGRLGMQFSPGGCVGWFYVPFANFVRPFKAVSELWRASDPQADSYSWTMASSTSLLGVWWGTWIVGNIISNISARIDDPSTSGGIGLMGSALIAVAAVACILLMRGVSARQGAAAAAQALGTDVSREAV